MQVEGVKHFERLFRLAASLDIDKSDVRRLAAFINQKLHDMLVIAVAHAKANGRDVILPHDLPITKGFQERIHEFRKYDVAVALQPVLDMLATLPPLELAYSVEVEEKLPEITGGLTVALAHAFKILDPDLKNPQSEHWERIEQLFDLLF